MATCTTLDFLRHGEPVGGKRYRGHTDDPLSEAGWAQMLAATAGDQPWQAVVSSPMSRCKAFAEWLADVAGLPMTVDERLKEVGFGVWEGKTAAELKRVDADAVFEFKRDPIGRRPAGAESLDGFRQRVVAAYEHVLVQNRGTRVLIVAHAGVIRMAICHALGLAPEQAYRINVGSAGLASIRIEEKGDRRLDTLMWLSRGA